MRLAGAVVGLISLMSASLVPAPMMGDAPPARVTILYDAFADRAGLERDWGFAALIEYGGRRILFDTGTTATSARVCVRSRSTCGASTSWSSASSRDHRRADAY
jgi:hypothetical protein